MASQKPFKKKPFAAPDYVEKTYADALRKIGSAVGMVVKQNTKSNGEFDIYAMNKALDRYSESLTTYAEIRATEFVRGVTAANKRSWDKQSKIVGAGLKKEINEAKLGVTIKKLIEEQVVLIKSLPRDAGLRAQAIALEAATGGKRPAEAAEMIMKTADVVKSRATLIARTETARANAAITRARSEIVGISSYMWQTSEDADVRESHAEVQGEIFSFDNPPTLSDGMTGNPGDFPNCRCFAVPIIPEAFIK